MRTNDMIDLNIWQLTFPVPVRIPVKISSWKQIDIDSSNNQIMNKN